MNQKETVYHGESICGLYCHGCTAYIATKEDPQRLEYLANRMGVSAEDVKCKGCHSDTLSFYCRTCHMKTCATKKGYNTCADCDEFPCEALNVFIKEKPHRMEILESLTAIKGQGIDKWSEKMKEDYTCRACGAINSAYDLKCRKCGNHPSNQFVKRNQESILKALGVK